MRTRWAAAAVDSSAPVPPVVTLPIASFCAGAGGAGERLEPHLH